ncbi:hypothetical protein GCM10027612_18190 [Microbispora bryophytorum subsp. camponoti]
MRMRQDDTVRHADEQEALARGNWRLLREALTHLALPASDQIEWLGSVLCPDELALDFDEAYQPSWQSREAGWISDEVAGYLDQSTVSLTTSPRRATSPGAPKDCNAIPLGSA